MTLDIRGSKKTTGISDNQFVVFEELLSNSIDSYLIRKDSNKQISDFDVLFHVELFSNDLVSDERLGLKITCTDNGAGMGDHQVKAFVTKDSTFKDDLRINGIGKGFGSGRIQYFHFFDHLNIESRYERDSKQFLRTLDVDSNIKEISEISFDNKEVPPQDLATSVSLARLSDAAIKRHFSTKSLPVEFSAKNIKRHILITFLQRFIALKKIINNFKITIKSSVVGHKKPGTVRLGLSW